MSISVLVLRSECKDGVESQEKHGNVGGNDRHQTNADDVMKMLQQPLHSLPITCDITVLPEIPLDSSKSVTHGGSQGEQQNHKDSGSLVTNDIRIEKQALNPCGMDNVLLLRDLPPTANRNSATYLLSLSSCRVQVSSSIDSLKNVVMTKQNLPIQAIPSTFSFSFENTNEAPSTTFSSSLSNGVVVNPTSASAELQVSFDFELALNRLEQEQVSVAKENIETVNNAKQDDTIVSKNHLKQENESPTVVNIASSPVLSEAAESRPASNHILQHDSPRQEQHSRHHHDQMLHVIRELAEKEAQHLDYMLAGLGLVFVLLLVHYTKTVMPLLRNNNKRKSTRHSVASMTTKRLVDAEGEKESRRPPVQTVTIPRSNYVNNVKNAHVPMLLEEHQHEQTITFSTDHGVVSSPRSPKTPFVTSESTICGGMAETSSLSSASAREMKQFTFLPSPKKEKENVAPEQRLSPCSKLAQRWELTKEQRRVSRKAVFENDHRASISPVAEVVLQSTENVRRAEEERPIASSFVDRKDESIKPPAVANMTTVANDENVSRPSRPLGAAGSRKVMVTPESRLVNEESFLQDYWGE